MTPPMAPDPALGVFGNPAIPPLPNPPIAAPTPLPPVGPMGATPHGMTPDPAGPGTMTPPKSTQEQVTHSVLLIPSSIHHIPKEYY